MLLNKGVFCMRRFGERVTYKEVRLYHGRAEPPVDGWWWRDVTIM